MVDNVAGTLSAVLGGAARRWPDRVFLHCVSERSTQDTVSFGELDRRSRRVSAGLLARGLRPGDRVAIAALNQAEWLELFFGAVRIGIVVVTLNVRYRESELEYMLNQSEAKLVISAAQVGEMDFEAFYPGFRQRIPGVAEVLFLGGGQPGQRYRDLPDPKADQPTEDPALTGAVRPSDPAVILYTSGTTGRPKGAVLTHASLLGAGSAQARRLGTTEHDVYSSAMPLNHVGGLTCTLISALAGGSSVLLAPTFSPANTLTDISRRGATVVAGVPTMWTLVLGHESFPDQDTSAVRVAVVGGSNADPTLCAAMAEGFPNARLCNLYGLSEVSGACVMSAPPDDVDTVARTLGTPLEGVAAKVVDPEGNEVALGGEGELWVRGPGAAAGYWAMPGESAEVFLPGSWVATGDIVSAEPDGHLIMAWDSRS